jgi:hypothetical protein
LQAGRDEPFVADNIPLSGSSGDFCSNWSAEKPKDVLDRAVATATKAGDPIPEDVKASPGMWRR